MGNKTGTKRLVGLGEGKQHGKLSLPPMLEKWPSRLGRGFKLKDPVILSASKHLGKVTYMSKCFTNRIL